jgi:tRNA 2-selenouridine synthase
MFQRTVPAVDFIKGTRNLHAVILDARSESEYHKAHIPGAINIPLLSNEHRKSIGIIYKQKGREAAVIKGFELVGPKFAAIIQQALRQAPQKSVYIYCWRGGMRSNIMAWMLGMAGFHVTLLSGGYKAFRNWVIQTLQQPLDVIVLGGKTGSGKTDILKSLAYAGEQIIDLEALANHKGSAFGALGQPPQPTTEHFENLVAWAWAGIDPTRRLWLENESRHIGSCTLPQPVYDLIRTSRVIELDMPVVLRRERITAEYGKFSFSLLAEATSRIAKRLGPQNLKEALWQLDENNFDEWLRIVLQYYDKLYSFGTTQRHPEHVIAVPLDSKNVEAATQKVLAAANGLLKNSI